MVAVEPHNSANTDEYITLFHRYISRSVEAVTTRLGPEIYELSQETREQAWHLLNYALQLAEGWEVARHLLLALAPRMERDGFRHEWLPFLVRAVACCQRANDRHGEAQVGLYIGRIHRLRSEYTDANRWFEASATLFQQVDEPAGRAKALNQLAYVARLQSKFDVAEALVDEALSLLDEDDPERAHSHWVLGTIATSQLDWPAAERHHQAALQIWQAAGDQRRAAWSLQNLGNTLRGAGRYAEAAGYIQQAIVALGQLQDPVNQAVARMNLGVVHIYEHDPTQALALLQLAEPVFRQVGDQLHLAMVYTNLMIVERDLDHLDAAIDYGMKTIRFCQTIEDYKMLGNAEDELGLCYLAVGRLPDAIAAFDAGLRHIAQVNEDPFQTMVQRSLLGHLEEAKQLENA